MTLVEKILVAVLAVGVWVLIAVTLTSSSVQAEGQELSRYDVERIVRNYVQNRCNVYDHMYLSC